MLDKVSAGTTTDATTKPMDITSSTDNVTHYAQGQDAQNVGLQVSNVEVLSLIHI